MVFATLSETPSKWPLHSTVPSLEIVIVDIAKAVTVQSLVPSENETKQWDLPESEGIFGAVVGVMLHIVEEAEEILQTLEADLITEREGETMAHEPDYVLHSAVREMKEKEKIGNLLLQRCKSSGVL